MEKKVTASVISRQIAKDKKKQSSLKSQYLGHVNPVFYVNFLLSLSPHNPAT